MGGPGITAPLRRPRRPPRERRSPWLRSLASRSGLRRGRPVQRAPRVRLAPRPGQDPVRHALGAPPVEDVGHARPWAVALRQAAPVCNIRERRRRRRRRKSPPRRLARPASPHPDPDGSSGRLATTPHGVSPNLAPSEGRGGQDHAEAVRGELPAAAGDPATWAARGASSRGARRGAAAGGRRERGHARSFAQGEVSSPAPRPGSRTSWLASPSASGGSGARLPRSRRRSRESPTGRGPAVRGGPGVAAGRRIVEAPRLFLRKGMQRREPRAATARACGAILPRRLAGWSAKAMPRRVHVARSRVARSGAEATSGDAAPDGCSVPGGARRRADRPRSRRPG